MIYVVSTGLAAPTRETCMASVAMQTGVECEHRYIEASLQNPCRDVITNQAMAICTMRPDDIVAFLDGDDWLAVPHALSRVQQMHESGGWVTWGSFEYADGRPGFAAPYHGGDVRAHDWHATHLKTMRAGLFQRLRTEDLTWPDGEPVPWDMVAMFAAIEMAGWDRTRYCDEILYVYNFGSSHEWNAGRDGRAREIELAREIRSRRPYERVEEL